MVASVGVNNTQTFVLGAASADNDVLVSQLYTLAAVNYPSENVSVSTVFVQGAVAADMDVRVSQLYVLAAVRGRVYDPRVRVWTYTLDGHDFYVIRCGNQETLVYDTHTGEWSNFGSGDSLLWRAYNGCNWLGGNSLAAGYGSNVVVGDDTNGSVYFLDPDGVADDDAVSGSSVKRYFDREITAAIPIRGRSAVPCYGVSITGSLGDIADSAFAEVTLSLSDDRGNNYSDVGTVTIDDLDYDMRLEWRSLGRMQAPGRLFRLKDQGALKRIDSFDLIDDGK